jgi:hypothetical protein
LTATAPDAINQGMRRRRRLGTALVSTLVLTGCGSSGGSADKDLEGLVIAATPPPTTVDLDRAGRDPALLARTLALPWSRASDQLGDHRITIKTVTEVREGAAVLETLADSTTIDLARDGTYHATYENAAPDGTEYGREVVYLGGTLYLRPRFARWHARGPETDVEPADIRDQLASALGAHVALYAHGLELSDKGNVQEAGRTGRRIEVKKAPSPRPAPRAELSQRSWRETARVDAAAGEVVLDDATGLPLRAHLDATVGFMRDGKPLTMHLTIDHAVVPGTVAVAKPDDDQVVATPTRMREVDDRNLLLQGIAPAAGKPRPTSSTSSDEPAPSAASKPGP